MMKKAARKRNRLTVILAVFSMIMFSLYILFYVLNSVFFTDDFFHTYVHKTPLLIMCLFAAAESVLMIAGNRKRLRRRLRRRSADGSGKRS